VHPDYLAAAAAARREELLRNARSRHRARRRGRRSTRLGLLIRVRTWRVRAAAAASHPSSALSDRERPLPVFGCGGGQIAGGE